MPEFFVLDEQGCPHFGWTMEQALRKAARVNRSLHH